ncbi:MAG TPA: 4Fe-4S ferredoxin, partial [Enterobacteriaceae bacterium]|nr:4Fe-4S ferredoxin [Enterobacteriaceae bacterium]
LVVKPHPKARATGDKEGAIQNLREVRHA